MQEQKCENLLNSYQKILSLKDNFDIELNNFLQTKNSDKLKNIISEIEEEQDKIEDCIINIHKLLFVEYKRVGNESAFNSDTKEAAEMFSKVMDSINTKKYKNLDISLYYFGNLFIDDNSPIKNKYRYFLKILEDSKLESLRVMSSCINDLIDNNLFSSFITSINKLKLKTLDLSLNNIFNSVFRDRFNDDLLKNLLSIDVKCLILNEDRLDFDNIDDFHNFLNFIENTKIKVLSFNQGTIILSINDIERFKLFMQSIEKSNLIGLSLMSNHLSELLNKKEYLDIFIESIKKSKLKYIQLADNGFTQLDDFITNGPAARLKRELPGVVVF